jgi:cytochrome oxidase Cu insertion factor (SCO1/SenC/PrrC family)
MRTRRGTRIDLVRPRLLIVVALAFAAGVLGALLLIRQSGGGIGQVFTTGRALVGGPFTLTDHTGRRVTDADFQSRYMLIFFGFTHCPDVCPTALQTMAAALEKLGPKAEKLVPLFITVDPERDTPEALASYVKSFHPRLIGLTGSAAEIAAAAKAYRAYYTRAVDEKSSAGYTMDHSTIVYLMAPGGAFVSHFTHTTTVESLTSALAKVL